MAYTALELANAFILSGELEDAIEALGPEMEQHPSDELWRLRADIYRRMERYAEALADLGRLTQVETDDRVIESIIRERMGDEAGAIHSMEVALALAPDRARYHERILYLYQKVADWQGARAHLAGLAAEWRWYDWQGDIEAADGHPEQAYQAYEAALGLLKAIEERVQDPILGQIVKQIMEKRDSLAEAF
ncbi:hypothetical protein MASR2M15_07790 [Anaerolineales bacterium]